MNDLIICWPDVNCVYSSRAEIMESLKKKIELLVRNMQKQYGIWLSSQGSTLNINYKPQCFQTSLP